MIGSRASYDNPGFARSNSSFEVNRRSSEKRRSNSRMAHPPLTHSSSLRQTTDLYNVDLDDGDLSMPRYASYSNDPPGILPNVHANSANGVWSFDITDPFTITPLTQIGIPGTAPFGIDAVGNLVYVADANIGLHILDYSDPALPTLLGSFPTDPAAGATKVQVVGSVAYVADSAAGLKIVDVSDPTSPTLLAAVPTPSICQDVTVIGNRAYCAIYNDGVLVLDISNPASPAVLGRYQTATPAQGITSADNTVYVADFNGLDIIDPDPQPQACTPDVNDDGILDNGDIGAFVTLFLAGDPIADFTGDGILDNGDIGAFVSAFLAGC